MIKVQAVVVAVDATMDGEKGVMFHDMSTDAYLSPHRIDTVTTISKAMRQKMPIPAAAKSIIRYLDNEVGSRLFYVSDDASDIARARRQELRGEDSDDPLGLTGMT